MLWVCIVTKIYIFILKFYALLDRYICCLIIDVFSTGHWSGIGLIIYQLTLYPRLERAFGPVRFARITGVSFHLLWQLMLGLFYDAPLLNQCSQLDSVFRVWEMIFAHQQPFVCTQGTESKFRSVFILFYYLKRKWHKNDVRTVVCNCK